MGDRIKSESLTGSPRNAQRWEHPEILPSEILRHAPVTALRESPAARAAIAIVAKHGWLVALPQGLTTRGGGAQGSLADRGAVAMKFDPYAFLENREQDGPPPAIRAIRAIPAGPNSTNSMNSIPAGPARSYPPVSTPPPSAAPQRTVAKNTGGRSKSGADHPA